MMMMMMMMMIIIIIINNKEQDQTFKPIDWWAIRVTAILASNEKASATLA